MTKKMSENKQEVVIQERATEPSTSLGEQQETTAAQTKARIVKELGGNSAESMADPSAPEGDDHILLREDSREEAAIKKAALKARIRIMLKADRVATGRGAKE